MPPKRALGGDTARNGRIGGLVRGAKFRKNARGLLERVKEVEKADMMGQLGAALTKKRSRSKKAVKVGARNMEKDVVVAMLDTATAAAEQLPVAVADAVAEVPSPSGSPEKKKQRAARAATDGAAAGLGQAKRGETLLVKARGAYNASTGAFDFNDEGAGARGSGRGVRRRVRRRGRRARRRCRARMRRP